MLNTDPVLKQYVGPVYWDEGGGVAFDPNGELLAAADWQCWKHGWEVDDCAEGYLNEIHRKDGGVVLLHCIHAQSAALVAAILPPLLQDGFRFVRLDEVPAYRQYETPAPAPQAATVSAVADTQTGAFTN